MNMLIDPWQSLGAKMQVASNIVDSNLYTIPSKSVLFSMLFRQQIISMDNNKNIIIIIIHKESSKQNNYHYSVQDLV